jgi:hypothetical protein
MRKKVLIVSPVPTHPPLAEQCVAVRRMAETFASLGHDVHLLFTNHEEGDTEAMHSAWGEDRFHQVPYHWPRRTARHLLYRERGLDYGWYSTTTGEEAQGLARADLVIALSDEEAAYFRRLVPRRAVTVGRTMHVMPPPQTTGIPGRVLFVASDTTINADGLVHFLDRVLPHVLEVVPGAGFHVAGDVGRHAAGRHGCVVPGRVEDLAPLYAAAGVVVNPVRFSTGLSIKSVEALGHARALVTTTAGSAGLLGKSGRCGTGRGRRRGPRRGDRPAARGRPGGPQTAGSRPPVRPGMEPLLSRRT